MDRQALYSGRLDRLRGCLRGKMDAALITNPKDIRYLSGFAGSSSMLLVAKDGAALLSDARYRTQAQTESCVPFLEFDRTDRYPVLLDTLRASGAMAFGYQDGHMTARELRTLEENLGNIALEPMGDIMLALRRVKSAEEIDTIAKAAAIADAAFASLLPKIHAGMSERECAKLLDIALLEHGASRASFPVIVVSGENGALPHGKPGERRFRRGDLVTMDFGAVYDGYCSDMTRTIAIGALNSESKALYEMVLEAQLTGLSALRSGVEARKVDKAARDILDNNGYGQDFLHGLGHGVGLDVHEWPLLNKHAEEKLQCNMVVTIEPGIYLPGRLGIRIEDLCVMEENGARRLSTTPKDLIVI